MENLKEISDAFRRASLASVKEGNYAMKHTKEPPPKDCFHLVHVLFLLTGIVHILPLTFFITANDYWMYKFRDTSSETVDLNNKTTLQTYFASGTMIAQSIPMVLCMLLSTAFGYRIKVRSRIVSSLALIAGLFTFFTALIKVNTDPWQTGFFILSLTGLSVICGILTLFQVSSLPLLSRFPPNYMHTFLIGQGIAGIFNACLQIISLGIGTSTETSALIYFMCGTIVVCTTLTLYIVSKHMAFYQYYVEDNVAESKEMLTKEEVKDVIKDIWPCLIIAMVTMVQIIFSHPSITSLVVSENYNNGSIWNDKFFVPTITYLYNDVCGLIGRLTVRRGWITRSSGSWWILLAILRAVTLIPLIMLCNAQPRSHLPVWFPHDWQYILIIAVFSMSNGFLFNIVFLSVNSLATGKEEAALMIMSCCFGISGGIFSPLSLLGVRML